MKRKTATRILDDFLTFPNRFGNVLDINPPLEFLYTYHLPRDLETDYEIEKYSGSNRVMWKIWLDNHSLIYELGYSIENYGAKIYLEFLGYDISYGNHHEPLVWAVSILSVDAIRHLVPTTKKYFSNFEFARNFFFKWKNRMFGLSAEYARRT